LYWQEERQKCNYIKFNFLISILKKLKIAHHIIQSVKTMSVHNNLYVKNELSAGYVQLADMSSPTNPSAGEGRLYKKTGNGGIFWLPDDTGPEVDLTNQTPSNVIVDDDTSLQTMVGKLQATDFQTDDYSSLNTELQKIDNFTASTATETNITGTLICTELVTDVIYDASQTTYIDMNAVTVTVFASDLALNGSSVITEAGNKNITGTLTTTQTVFSSDQELITKKYVDDATPETTNLDTKTQNISLSNTDTTKTTMSQELILSAASSGNVIAIEGQGADIAIDGITDNQLYVRTGFEFIAQANLSNIRFLIKSSQRGTDTSNRGVGLFEYDADTFSYTEIIGVTMGSYGGTPAPIIQGDYNISYDTPPISLVAGTRYAVMMFAKAGDHFSNEGVSNLSLDGNIHLLGSLRTDSTNNIGTAVSTNDGYAPFLSIQYVASEVFNTKLSCGNIDNKNGIIYNVSDPINRQDVATKNYVDVVDADNGKIPSMRMVGYNQSSIAKYVNNISSPNSYSETLVITDQQGDILVANAYIGGSYSPTLNRIYFAPFGQANQTIWHFINCKLGKFIDYIHGATVVSNGYSGSVYSPTENRIYFIPFEQASQNQWHYINCDDNGTIVAYTHEVTAVSQAYSGGVYSPLQNRIYLVPYAQASQNQWHYIDCSDGSVVAYTHSTSAVSSAYSGGVYSHSKNRIYFVPFAQAPQTQWHYVNCSNEDINAYTNSATAVSQAYNGAVYSPTQNRIYFIPYAQAPQTQWHYLNCSNNAVVAYTHGATVSANGYSGASLMPSQNRIYLVPYGQANQTNWHYIDCSDGSVVSYVNRATAVVNAYNRCVYSPHENEIYLAPYAQGPELTYHTLLPLTSGGVSLSFASSTLMGN
jgi:hypothetical protein